MPGRTVDLDQRAGLGRQREQLLVVEIVSGARRHHAIGGMRDHRHQRVAQRADVAVHQLLTALAGALVQRRQHDVEPLQQAVGKIEPAVGQDVGFAAVQNRDPGMAFAQLRNLVRLARDVARTQIARGGGALRMIGDGHVLVSERAAGDDHALDGVAAVAPDRVHVQVAANLAAGDQCRELAAARGLHLLLAVSDFWRNQRQIERGINLLFRRRHPQRIVVAVKSPRGEAQPGRRRRVLQRGKMLARAGQVEQCGTRRLRLGKTDPDLHAVDEKVKTPRAAVQPARLRERQQLIDRLARGADRRQQLDVADGVLAAAQGSKRLRPAHAGQRPQPAQQRFGDGDGTAQRDARNRRAKRRQGGFDLLRRRRPQARVFVDRAVRQARSEIGT